MIAHLMLPVFAHMGGHIATIPMTDYWNTVGTNQKADVLPQSEKGAEPEEMTTHHKSGKAAA